MLLLTCNLGRPTVNNPVLHNCALDENGYDNAIESNRILSIRTSEKITYSIAHNEGVG